VADYQQRQNRAANFQVLSDRASERACEMTSTLRVIKAPGLSDKLHNGDIDVRDV